MTQFRHWSAKQGLNVNRFKVFHDVVPLFNPKSLLLQMCGLCLGLSCFLSPSYSPCLSSLLLLTREKENSVSSGPQVHLFWSWLQLCSLLSRGIGAESVLLPLTISAFFFHDTGLGFIPPQQYSLCPAFTLFSQRHELSQVTLVSFTTLLHLKYLRPSVYILIHEP